MKKINLKGFSKTLNEKELRNVMGGGPIYYRKVMDDNEDAIDGYGLVSGMSRCPW
ncbi:MAG: TIGR04149 family rSAM-modified RiPP [Dysgonamonadaceae bacterium]|jgi:natural product precursor|nr:TIGR04149 family rSAM-modified RiPP [Dysgonamonadaceae bacterium]